MKQDAYKYQNTKSLIAPSLIVSFQYATFVGILACNGPFPQWRSQKVGDGWASELPSNHV